MTNKEMMRQLYERMAAEQQSPHALTRRRRGGWRYCLSKQRIVGPQFRLTGACRPYDPALRKDDRFEKNT